MRDRDSIYSLFVIIIILCIFLVASSSLGMQIFHTTSPQNQNDNKSQEHFFGICIGIGLLGILVSSISMFAMTGKKYDTINN